MTTLTLTPNGTFGLTGTVVGSSSITALDDDDDATYIEFDALGERIYVSFDDVSLPAGSVLRGLRAVFRQSDSAPGLRHWETLIGDGSNMRGWVYTSTATPATLEGNELNGASFGGITITDTFLDALQLAVIHAGGGTMRLYEARILVRYVEKPTLTVTLPTGTVNTTFPTVAWTSTLDSDGGPQTRYEVKAFSAAQYSAGGFDPATSESSGAVADNAWVASTAVNITGADGTYRAYVRIAQTVDGALHWSDWTYSEFELVVLLPAVPMLTVAAENAEGRIRIDLAANAGDVSTDEFELQRSDDGGATWVAIQDGELVVADVGSTPTLYDYHAPAGVLLTYRARALHTASGPFAESASAWVEATVTWLTINWWIKHPTLSELNFGLPAGVSKTALVSYPGKTKAARQGMFQPLGASLPVVVSDTRGGAAGVIVVQLETTEDLAALDALLDTADTLLLQGPAADGHPDRYVKFGDATDVRVIDKGWSHVTRITLPWVEVEGPA